MDSNYQEAHSDRGCPLGCSCDVANCPELANCLQESIDIDSQYDPSAFRENPEVWSDAP